MNTYAVIQRPRRIPSYVEGDLELYSFGPVTDPLLPLDVCLVGRSAWAPGEHFERAGMFEWGVELVIDGHGILTARGRTYDLLPGDVFFFRPYEHVRYATAPGAPGWCKVFLDFFPGGVALIMHQLGLAETSRVRVAPERLPRVRALFERILRLARARRPGCRTAISIAAYQLLLALSHEVLEPPHRDVTPAPVARVMTYLDEHCNQPFDSALLAQVAGCSVRQLNRYFNRLFGMSSHAWVEHTKIQRACLMLTHRADPIAVIAQDLGYRDPLYFCKVFKRATGQSPRAFRRQLVAPKTR